MKDKVRYIPYDQLLARARKLLIAAGLSAEHAHFTAEAVCTASLRGTDSHGIRLLPHYLAAVKAGRIDPEAEFEFTQTAPGTGFLDARHGIAHAAVAMAMDHAIELAAGSGSGFVAVKNSNHCGAMAYYGLRAAQKDMIGLAFTNASPKLKVFNTDEPFFGINPVCFTAPMAGEEPFCYDASPAVMSNNKVKMLKAAGEGLPPDVAADENGKMTLDPAMARMLLPLGGAVAGYKGFGMAMMGDILCSLLSGMPNGRHVSTMYPSDGGHLEQRRRLGQMTGAIRIDRFVELEDFKRRLKHTADTLRSLARSQDATDEVMVAGDPEKRARSDRLQNGIPVPEHVWRKIRD